MKEQTSRAEEIRRRNIAVASAIKGSLGSSLGPRGMDKMITKGASTTITNDGSTILKSMEMTHPVAKVISNISRYQDEENGDGTTTVTILMCALLEAAEALLKQKIHPVVIANAMEVAKDLCKQGLRAYAERMEDEREDERTRSCIRISLSSKIVSAYIDKITDITVGVIKHITASAAAGSGAEGKVNLRDVRIVKIKGAIEDSRMVKGIVLAKELKRREGPLGRKALKMAVLQCTIGQSKPHLDSKIVVSDFNAMENVIREEKRHVLEICKKIREKGIGLVLIQKSILRESLSELGLHFLGRMGVLVVDDIERTDIEFYLEKLGLLPVVDPGDIRDEMVKEVTVEEIEGDENALLHIIDAAPKKDQEALAGTTPSPMPRRGERVCSVILRGTDDVILEEVARSFNDAINVARLIVETPLLTYGGGVPELICYTLLSKYEGSGDGRIDYCVKGLAQAFLSIPSRLAINSGIDPIDTVEALVKMHASDIRCGMGVSVKENGVGDMRSEEVLQPVGVSLGGVSGALDGASVILRIDDLIPI